MGLFTKALLTFVLLSGSLVAQTRWSMTTGDVALSGTALTATIQQPATGASTVVIDQIVVYCSVDCSVTQAANGTAATSTAGTVTAILPSTGAAPFTFWTVSNVGAGTVQGGILHIAAKSTVVFCLSRGCGITGDVTLTGNGTGKNYSVTVAAITGTANITIYTRTF